MKAEIISIGRELLMGEIVDTNASFLAKQMSLLGIDLIWVSQVGDVQKDIVEVLRRAWGRSDVILTTGGLGPTADDLTRESIAETMEEKLFIVPELETALRERFRRFGMQQMPESNMKQCTLIPSAKTIPNLQGTAPGWWIEKDGRVLVCMPGPPRELYDMWDKEIRGRLQGRSGQVIVARTWKTSGYSEAAVGEMSFPLFPSDNPSLGVYAKSDGIHLQLKVAAKTHEEARAILAEGEAKIRQVFDTTIWGIDEETLETAVGKLLVERGRSLAVIEDYSGGLLTKSLAEVSASPTFFRGGVVALSDEAKLSVGVPTTAMSRGAGSEEVAIAMAEAARTRFGADIGIGIGGMGEGEASGTVHFAICDGGVHETGTRPRFKERLGMTVLFDLRKLLLATATQAPAE